jgi:hypothetical protein
MQAFGVPRLDAGAEGIHLVWSWPDVLPLSIGGYDIQRIGAREQRWVERCEDIDRRIIAYLRGHGEYPAPLGPLRMRTGVQFKPIIDPKLYSPSGDPGDHPLGFGDPTANTIHPKLSAVLASSKVPSNIVTGEFDLFIQELLTPVERASVQAVGRFAISMAVSKGKVVQIVPGAVLPATMQLQAPSIDTILVYILSPESLRICVYERPFTKEGVPDPVWDSAPYIVKGLTLPIHEADAALTTPALEYAAATARMIAGESLTLGDFVKLATTLRQPTAATMLGRSGERIVLVRSDVTQSYEELPFDMQLGALALHPKARRVLGFGFRDHKGLTPGASYMYRITGRFRAEDLTDAIYDVHRVPASTPLPAAFSIRDLSLRFQTPVSVVLDPTPSTTALQAASRRGIRIDTTGFDGSWFLPSFGGWSAVIGLPRPVTKVVLEVAPGHSFAYAGGLPWIFGSPPPTPLPAGHVVLLTFATPIQELRLAGTGTLYAIRLPSGKSGVIPVHAYAGPITYAAEPLPAPPVILTAYNLQQPLATLTGPIDESTPVAARPPVGFKLNWLPTTVGGLGVWPVDVDSGPPIDALAYKIQHRKVTPPTTFGPWEPIAGDDNLTVGSRDDTAPDVRLEFGCDLDALFPAVRPRGLGAGFVLHLSDVFGENDPATGRVLRPEQPLGSYHQYEIQSMDAVGRVSATMTLSNIARLEKHVPPPLPVGPQPEAPLDGSGNLTAPPGPRARAIIAGAPGLTADDVALLGAHQNAILLEWGWRLAERDLDPTTAEFRVYSALPQDVVEGTITAVASLPPHWKIGLTTNVPLVANELVGQWVTSNGYPFRIAQNDGGTAPSMLVEVSTLKPALQPVPGSVTFGRPLQPAHQRAGGWDQRVAVYPLTSSDTYRHVFYDVLNLSVTHPRDALWVGVSAADAQPYVPDERTVGTFANRLGNESGIVTCGIIARYIGQPTFSIPPPLGDVPEIVTDEPTGRQVLASLDLSSLLGGALLPGAPCVLERCSSDDIISRTSLSGGNVILTHPDGTQEIIPFPNPGDHAAVIATLSSDNPQRLANKYLLHLVVASSDSTAFFQRIGDDILQVGPVDDRLAPKPGRFLYFVRAADALGHISAGGGILPVIVRVPSTAGAAKPEKRALTTTDTAVTLTVAVTGADPDTTTALLFAAIAPPGKDPPVQGMAELLRMPNRRDLYPNDGLRLQLSDGTLLAPAVAKNLSDMDVTIEGDGTRVAALTTAAAKGSWVTLWCYGLTRDGLPSYVCGPFGTGVRA